MYMKYVEKLMHDHSTGINLKSKAINSNGKLTVMIVRKFVWQFV